MYATAYIWAKVLNSLEDQLTEVMVRTWLDDTEVIELKDGKLILYSPSDFRQENIRVRCAPYIEQALRDLFHIEAKLEVWGDSELRAFREQRRNTDPIRFNPQFTFANYVTGASNQIAVRIAQRAAEEPGQDVYNPLFVYGPTGVGKTHLLYAIANHVMELHPELKVMYVRGDQFTNELIHAIGERNTTEFKKKYRYEADVLLIDDVQFIAGKEQTQEEFFHTFNELYAHKKQIVMTADRKPSDMATLEDRLRSRFGEGILVGISPPDHDTRLAIIQAKARRLGLALDEETLAYLTDRLRDNVRQIEGALKKLRAFHDLGALEMTLPNVMRTVEDIVTADASTAVTAPVVIRQVCRYFGVDEEKLKSPQKSKNIALPRQIAMYLCRRLIGMSYIDIGKEFQRDHGTVHHAVKKVEEDLARKDSSLKGIMDEIISNIDNPV